MCPMLSVATFSDRLSPLQLLVSYEVKQVMLRVSHKKKHGLMFLIPPPLFANEHLHASRGHTPRWETSGTWVRGACGNKSTSRRCCGSTSRRSSSCRRRSTNTSPRPPPPVPASSWWVPAPVPTRVMEAAATTAEVALVKSRRRARRKGKGDEEPRWQQRRQHNNLSGNHQEQEQQHQLEGSKGCKEEAQGKLRRRRARIQRNEVGRKTTDA